MDNGAEAALESACKNLIQSTADLLQWKWDGRFGAALAEFSVENLAAVQQALDNSFPRVWVTADIGSAPEAAQKMKGSLGGLMAGQRLFTTQPDSELELYAAWWPWGNGERISIRIVAPFRNYAVEDPNQLQQDFKSWFGV